jgi:ribonuclease P protein component
MLGSPETAPESGQFPQGQTAGSGKPDQRLGRNRRLTRTSLFQQTYAQGRRVVGRAMVLWLREGEGASLRLGVVASRKVGGAVQRARAKRLMREAYRRNRHRFSGPFDVVLVARRGILETRWDDIVGELLDLARRMGLMDSEGGVT